MSILSTLQIAMPLCGVAQPAQAVSSTDPTVIKFIAMAQDLGDELRERYFWRNLNIGGTIAGDGTTTQFALPPDWAQLSPGEQLFSSLYPTLPLIGPVTNEQMAYMKSVPTFSTRPAWRLIGSNIEFFPALGAGEAVTFNYYSTNWVSNAAGTSRQPGFLLDSDFSMIDEIVLRRGLIFMWKELKGLDYQVAMSRYAASVDRAAGREDTGRVVSMARNMVGENNRSFAGTITDLTDHIY